MQRLYLSGITKKIRLVDRWKFAAVVPYKSSVLRDTCLGPDDHQISAQEFPIAAVDQVCRSYYCLKRLMPIFLSGWSMELIYCDRVNLLSRYRFTKLVAPSGLPVFQVCPPTKLSSRFPA